MPEIKIENLNDFVRELEKAGELLRIRERVSPICEISEITDRHSKTRDADGNYGGKALLFEKCGGLVVSLAHQFDGLFQTHAHRLRRPRI